MGYREYAKDYEVEYVSVKGKRRKKAVRTYVGPWFRFRASAERIKTLKRLYLIGLSLLLVLILVPLFVDCTFTRLWYVQLPGVLRTIPMVFALSALWRLWTAGEKVEREHSDFLSNRMNSASFFLMGFSLVGVISCAAALIQQKAAAADYVICAIQLLSAACSIVLFANRRDLEMVPVSRP